jgi:hypothetical protein
MLEKRWLLRVGRPAMVAGLVIASAVGLSGHPEGTRSHSALVREVSSRDELRRVAPDIADRAWLAERGNGRWVFGQAGTAIVRALPATEDGIAIGDRYVASVTARDGGMSHVVLREWRTGSVAAEIDAPLWVSAGAFRGNSLVVTGYGDAAATTDGGLGLIDPSTGFRLLMAAGSFPADLAGRPVHGDVLVSPNGVFAATNACGTTGCITQVIDVDRGAIVRTLRGESFLRALTDEAIVLTDDDYRRISAVGIRTGQEIWRETDSILMTPLAGADGAVTALVGSEVKGWAAARIDRTGRIRDLTARTHGGTWRLVWTQLSTPRTVVVGAGDFGAALADRTRGTADLFDVAAASAIGRNVLVLPAE